MFAIVCEKCVVAVIWTSKKYGVAGDWQATPTSIYEERLCVCVFFFYYLLSARLKYDARIDNRSCV